MYAYTDTEDEIVQRLQEKLPEGYQVMALPEKEKQVDLPDDGALIIVAYSDSQFDPPSSTDIIKQTERVTVLLNIKSPRLRGNFSIKESLQLVKLFILGFAPANMGKLYLQKIEFDERDPGENYFSYNVTFVANKIHMEVLEELQGPLLKKLTLINSGDFYNPDYSGSDFVTQHTVVEVESQNNS